MKLLKVNDILLDEPLFLDDEFKDNEVISSSQRAIDGTEIVFLQKNKAKELNFSSQEISWNGIDVVRRLIALANSSDESEISLMTDQGSKSVRFDYFSGAAVSAEPLFKGSNQFFIEIKFKLI